MFRLLRDEAIAYLRLGLLSPQRRRIDHNRTGTAEVGVLFVPGVGANGSQFLSMRRKLEAHASWFGSFEYFSLGNPRDVARRLRVHIDELGGRVEQLVVVGHSLGGLLARMVLQGDAGLANVAGFVSICAPLNGTWRSKLAPSANLRMLRPDSPMMTEVLSHSDRLRRWNGRIVTIGARRDQFIDPADSAMLEGARQIVLEDSAHAGSLFDPRVHDAVVQLVQSLPRR